MTEEPTPARASPWRVPLALAGAGLVLMLGGYALLSHIPTSALEPLRQMAEQDPAQREFADRLRGMEDQHRAQPTPLFRVTGAVTFYAGLLLFIAAGLRMYRKNPEATLPEEDSEENLKT